MDNRALVQTKSNLSYAGAIFEVDTLQKDCIILKPSDKSGVLIVFPRDEIKALHLPNGKMIKGDEIYGFGL